VQIHHTFIINIIVNDDEFTWMCIFNNPFIGLSMVFVVSKFAQAQTLAEHVQNIQPGRQMVLPMTISERPIQLVTKISSTPVYEVSTGISPTNAIDNGRL